MDKIKLFFKKLRANPKTGKLIKWFIIIAIVVVVLIKVRSNMTDKLQNAKPIATVSVETRDLEQKLTASGVIEPQDQYSVIPLVQGEILEAPFEEGKQVKKGDLLYQIDTKDIKNAIKSAELSVKQAKNAYETAKRALEDVQLTSQVTGYVQSLTVKEGDMVTMGMQIADIYDNTSMYLTVPFNEEEMKGNWIGKKATVYVGDNAEKLSGSVTEVSPVTEVLVGGRIVRQVKILVKNPGGIAKGMTGTATVNKIDCNSAGTFDVKEQTVLVASASGKITDLNLKDGQFLSKGEVYASLDSRNIESQIRDAKTAIENAELNLETQKNNLKNYSITAPISGQVIKKNMKKGDKINIGSGSVSNEMAVIYDLSSLKFEMKIDELDIESIKVGQTVQVTSDAFPEAKLTGKVENISLQSINQNGVTQYPVQIRINKKGDLLPGMNVEGKIVTAYAEQAQCVPVECLMKGNQVYVKDDSLLATDTKKKGTKKPKAISGKEAMNTNTSSDIPEGFRAVSVEIGISDGDYVEIKSGLNADDEIYLPSAPSNTYNPFMMSEDMGQPSEEE